MQPAPQKSKSYGSLAILGILGLALWHPGLSGMAKPSTMNITVAQNTPITLRLEQTLSTRTSAPGQHFGAKLVQPLVVNGNTVLPVGTEFSGTVARAAAAGKLAGGANLRIVLNSFSFQGKEYEVKCAPLARAGQGQGKRTAELAGGVAAIGAVIGVIAGGREGAAIGAAAGAGAGTVGAYATNKTVDIAIPAESLVTFHLAEPVTVTITPKAPARRSWLFS